MITDVTCEVCGFPYAVRDTDIMTGEETRGCAYCGSMSWTTRVLNKDGTPKTKKDGNYIYRKTKHVHYGGWLAVDDKTETVIGGVFDKPNEYSLEEIKALVENGYGIPLIFFSTVVDGKVKSLVNEGFLPEPTQGEDTQTEQPHEEDKRLKVFEDFFKKLDVD
jgi:hypothetical protein